MSDEVVISVSHLSKSYRLGTISSRTLREDLSRAWARLLRKPDPLSTVSHLPSSARSEDRRSKIEDGATLSANSHLPSSTSAPSPISRLPSTPRSAAALFWALRDVSFEVKQGEVLGIIGANGAGKSTLLKILSRITAPTDGEVRIKGRIGSLLEVGTGFHPDLTGRENVFLNGAILGMSRSEISRKFDEIVAFSGLEQFIDTPVKRYSSGMYVRLAFAVAAHLDPEILVLDEVLAVGDAEFQKRCLGKMSEVAKGGRTVLFVSHNMGAIANLCTRVLLCSHGSKVMEGPPAEAISCYVGSLASQPGSIQWDDPKDAPGNDNVRLRAVHIRSDGKTTSDINIHEAVQVCIEFWNLSPGLRINPCIHLLDKVGVEVLASSNFPSATPVRDEWFGRSYPAGLFRTICTVPGNFLNEGAYSVRVALCSDVTRIELLTPEIISFTVHETGQMRKEYSGHWLGVVRPKLAWQTEILMKEDELKPARARVDASIKLINLNEPFLAGPRLLDIADRVLKEFKSDVIGAEFGVAYGGGIQAIGKMWAKKGLIYGFDTFEGHPKHIAKTETDAAAVNAVDMWYDKYGMEKLSVEYIQSVLSAQGLDNVKLVKGLVTESTEIDYIPYLDYVLLDLDFPTAMRTAYRLVKDKLTSGSYLCLHDVSPTGRIPGVFQLYEDIKKDGLYEVVVEDFPADLVVLKRIHEGNGRLQKVPPQRG